MKRLSVTGGRVSSHGTPRVGTRRKHVSDHYELTELVLIAGLDIIYGVAPKCACVAMKPEVLDALGSRQDD